MAYIVLEIAFGCVKHSVNRLASGNKIASVHKLRSYYGPEIGHVGSSVPGISDMASVHYLSINVSQVFIRNLVVFGQVIVQDVCTNG